MSTGTKTFDWPLFIHRLHVFNVAVEAPILQAGYGDPLKKYVFHALMGVFHVLSANWKISLMIPSITPRFVLVCQAIFTKLHYRLYCNTQIATILLLNIDALLETDPDVMYEAQVPTR